MSSRGARDRVRRANFGQLRHARHRNEPDDRGELSRHAPWTAGGTIRCTKSAARSSAAVDAFALRIDRRHHEQNTTRPAPPQSTHDALPARNARSQQSANQEAGIVKRFTIHRLRCTFTDLVRRANVDAAVRRALTGHVTEMRRHDSTVGLDERRAAIAGVLRLVPPSAPQQPENAGWTSGGTNEGSTAPTTEKVANSMRAPLDNTTAVEEALDQVRASSTTDGSSGAGGTRGGTSKGNGLVLVASLTNYPGAFTRFRRAGYRIRTGDLQLGKLTLYR